MKKGKDILPTKTLQQTSHLDHFYFNLSTYPDCHVNGNTQDSFAEINYKPQRERTSFTDNHLKVLEDCFTETRHPDTNLREKLAIQLGLPLKTIQIWFQNRRAKERRRDNEKANAQRFRVKKEHECSTYQQTGTAMPESQSKDYSFQNDNAVIQIVDSSNTYPRYSLQQNCETGKEFTIVHIQETCESLQDSNMIYDHDCNKDCGLQTSEDNNIPNSLLTTEMQNIGKVLNLDLIINTYEVLLSSKDAGLLIKKWSAESELQNQKEKYGNDLTLEDNLKRFINYSRNY